MMFAFIIGALFLGIGFYLRFAEEKRHFYRRNMSGIEEFKSYWDSKIQGAIDIIMKTTSTLLMFGGAAFCISGFVLLLSKWSS